MDNVVTEVISQWGILGILIIFAIWIIYDYIKDKPNDKNRYEHKSNDSSIELVTTLITNISHKIDKVENKVDKLEEKINSANNRLTTVEVKLNSQPQTFMKHMDKLQKERTIEHNKQMEDQMKLGPELHKILSVYKKKTNSNHIFLGSFHNGTTNISGIPYCKFDIIAEKFSPDEVDRDVEYAFMYKDADILRHDKLPITVLQEGRVHYIIDENGKSELAEVDDIIYRRMIGRDIKQLAVNITRDGTGSPSGFVGCVRYDYEKIDLNELTNCAKELEIIYRNSIN